MSYIYLLGTGYCERCTQICGRRRARQVKPRREKPLPKKEKPLTLKYVRYFPGTSVTPGWNGTDKPVVVPRVPAYWTYAGALARRTANNMGSVPVVPVTPALPVPANSTVSRKRKHVD
ncbi:hypothetical protein [psittacine adenovirus 6]|uniref:Uncharacterized protein n=1 Tax=psittacine adenovirus 6 TaxID=3071234 RepID=A0AAE7C137_9ADEN|nr:hypothetical protein [psittacine adenovirus 6]